MRLKLHSIVTSTELPGPIQTRIILGDHEVQNGKDCIGPQCLCLHDLETLIEDLKTDLDKIYSKARKLYK